MFLLLNVVTMMSCSTLVIARKHSEYAVCGLLGVVVTQALGYGLIFDLNFFLRNLSVVGGLLMVLSDSFNRKRFAFAGLPQIDEKDKKVYFQLAGRVLLVFLFIGFVFSGEWSISRVIVSMLGFVACVMVVVGFKAKFSAILLVVILSIFNVLINNWWSVSAFLSGLPRMYCSQTSSFITTTRTATSPSTTFSRSCRLCKFGISCTRNAPANWTLVAVSSSSSTWAPASSLSMKRRRFIRGTSDTMRNMESEVRRWDFTFSCWDGIKLRRDVCMYV